MRAFAILVGLAACGSTGPNGNELCPSNMGLSCSSAGAVCDRDDESGPTTCRCNGATWTCTDCPGGELPKDACTAGATCEVWGFENACGCTCDASGWHCVVDDPDPNFHCSF